MEQRNPRLRWLIVWSLAVVWIAIILARLSYLQLFCYSEYLAKAQRQQQRIFEISPMRGPIYDRKGRELAVSLPMDSAFADPAEITDVGMVAKLLSRVLDVSADDLEARIEQARTPVRLARKVPPEAVQRISEMNLKGVFFQKENRRVYPQRALAASVLGYVDVDEKGSGGIEYSLDKQILGRPGKMMVLANGRRQWYDRSEAAADPGASVTLTIDETVQYIAEKELAKAIEQTQAKAGTVVIEDPNSGELLAVANWPTFDPNDPGRYPDEDRVNRAVASAYEPGSTFKVITLTGAIESGVARAEDLIDCQMGQIMVAGRLIHDWKKFGVLSVREILEHSSDVGAIKLALRLGGPRFYDTARAFGIGQSTGIELPGENRGLLRPVENWSASSIGSLAMGQEVSVTPIQIISAISAVANGGTLYAPHVVREIHGGGPSGLRVPREPRLATDARTAATMRELMEGVIREGTGKPARLDGYTAAGKSGTAQKIDPATGRYSRTQYNSSFVGFAPVNNPVITILVVLDSPVGPHHGGEVGGPVFKHVAEQVLTYLGVSHDVPSAFDTETAENLRPAGPMKSRERDAEDAGHQGFADVVEKGNLPSVSAPTMAFGDQTIAVPTLTGQSVRGVTELCSKLGLAPALIGTGIALEQFPEPGTQVLRGSQVTVRFGRPGELESVSARRGGN